MDDVFTTGATVNECAKVPKKIRGQAGLCLTLARVGADEKKNFLPSSDQSFTGPSQKAGTKDRLYQRCFDLLHIGHVRYLQEARTLGTACSSD